MFRNIFTDNIFQSWISTYHTKLNPPNYLNNSINQANNTNYDNQTINLDHWNISSEETIGPNIMSVVLISLIIGIYANKINLPGGKIIVDLIEAINSIIMSITMMVVQFAPLCTVFLIIPQLLVVDDLLNVLHLIGWFVFTVLIGLTIHCLITLSAIYYIIVGKNPYSFLGQMAPAISTAFATSSSSATMSVTIRCLECNVHVSSWVARFFVPFGSTVNMDGAALYESVAAIFVAQYRKKNLSFGQLITISMTSILVSIGAAGIPQAGMITTVIVLQTIGLSLQDAALIMMVDFMLDRFRTVVNVLGDGFGSAIISSRLKNLFPPQEDQTNNNTSNNDSTTSTSVSKTTNNDIPSSKLLKFV